MEFLRVLPIRVRLLLANLMLDHKCADGDCEHEDECPSVLVDVCRCCTEIAYQVSDEYWPAAMDEITWPCPTVAALTQGGEGS